MPLRRNQIQLWAMPGETQSNACSVALVSRYAITCFGCRAIASVINAATTYSAFDDRRTRRNPPVVRTVGSSWRTLIRHAAGSADQFGGSGRPEVYCCCQSCRCRSRRSCDRKISSCVRVRFRTRFASSPEGVGLSFPPILSPPILSSVAVGKLVGWMFVLTVKHVVADFVLQTPGWLLARTKRPDGRGRSWFTAPSWRANDRPDADHCVAISATDCVGPSFSRRSTLARAAFDSAREGK